MIFDIDKKPQEDRAIIFQNRIISYGQLKDRIVDLKQKIGQDHCLIFCLCQNCPDSLTGYLAFLDSGNVPLLLDGKISADTLNRLVEIYKPDYIYRPVLNSYDYELVKCDSPRVDQPGLHKDLALLLTTSGSTGSPKLVRLSLKNICSNACSIAEYLHLDKNERPITSLPMYYTYGLSVINSHLLAGACIVMTDRTVFELEFWKTVDKQGVTSLSGVPYTYQMLDQLRFTDGSLGKSIKTFTQAGGHLPEKLHRKFLDFSLVNGKEFVVMYGQTEATARMSYLPFSGSQSRIGSIGIPIPGGMFELRRDDGSLIENTDETGELVYLGENVSLGYATCREDLCKGDERNGLLFTGDMARRDKDGFYYIKGRKKRFLKMRGNRISLDECEALLYENYRDCEFVCSGSDDLLTIYKTNKKVLDAGLYLASRLNLDYHLFREIYIPKIPRTGSGKVDYSKINNRFVTLTDHHRTRCKEYNDMISAVEFDGVPFLPSGIFKSIKLSSIDEGTDHKIATSSGTSDSAKSMVVIDGKTSTAQQMALVDIVTEYIGPKRLPMLVIDSKETVSYGFSYSARAAAIQGFSIFGRDRTFALDENLELDVKTVEAFLEKYKNEEFLIFGFTYLVWQILVEKVEELAIDLDMSKAILIHGGGWKKLEDIKVSNEEYKLRLMSSVGISRCYDYYGMAEQAGSIFMECERGYFHASKYSDIITRRGKDFSECDFGEKGIIQVLSTLPESYPGHSILTTDEGVIIGEDDCPCKRKGKYFLVNGRVKNAVLRGCSDLRTASVSENLSSTGISFVLGDEDILNDIKNEKAYKVFDEKSLEFLDCWSKAIRSVNASVIRSDIASFGFWIRRTNLELMRKNYSSDLYEGRGCSLHFAPSNIPSLFAYSMTSSLLAGNTCIVRLPGMEDEGIDLMVEALAAAIEESPEFEKRIILIRYPHNKEITDKLSKICQTRIIWGGDGSIEEIQRSPIEIGAKDICFGDRDSFAVFEASRILEAGQQELDSLIRNFYNDTYLTDQNACSSPKIIFWHGNEDQCQFAKELFWKNLHEFILDKYQVQDMMAINKLEQVMMAAAKIKGCKSINTFKDNFITRVNIDDIAEEDYLQAWNFTMPGGFFLEKNISSLDILEEFITEKCQTMIYYGFDEDKLKTDRVKRIVPAGQGLAFDLLWDGVDLIQEQIK